MGVCTMGKGRSMKRWGWVIAALLAHGLSWGQATPESDALLQSLESWVGKNQDEELKWLKREFEPWLEASA